MDVFADETAWASTLNVVIGALLGFGLSFGTQSFQRKQARNQIRKRFRLRLRLVGQGLATIREMSRAQQVPPVVLDSTRVALRNLLAEMEGHELLSIATLDEASKIASFDYALRSYVADCGETPLDEGAVTQRFDACCELVRDVLRLIGDDGLFEKFVAVAREEQRVKADA